MKACSASSNELFLPAGYVIQGPDGQGYRLKHDVYRHAMILAADFEPVGGAPEPIAGEVIPEWVAKALGVYDGD